MSSRAEGLLGGRLRRCKPPPEGFEKYFKPKNGAKEAEGKGKAPPPPKPSRGAAGSPRKDPMKDPMWSFKINFGGPGMKWVCWFRFSA